jgi:putative flippase GtrA
VLVQPIVKLAKLKRMAIAGISGIAATVCDVGALMVLAGALHVWAPVAAFFAASFGAVVCFLMNKHVAFRDRTPVTWSQVARFGFVAVANALLTAVAMKLVAVDLHVNILIAKLVCAAVVFVAWTYPAQRRLVFRTA